MTSEEVLTECGAWDVVAEGGMAAAPDRGHGSSSDKAHYRNHSAAVKVVVRRILFGLDGKAKLCPGWRLTHAANGAAAEGVISGRGSAYELVELSR